MATRAKKSRGKSAERKNVADPSAGRARRVGKVPEEDREGDR